MTTKLNDAMTELEAHREQFGLDKGGKKYSMVKDRVHIFRKHFGTEYGIDTNVEHGGQFSQGSVVMATAKIIDPNNRVVASGHAMDFFGSNEVTMTSAVEAVETSAIGRALACFGLHGGEYASGDEMAGVDRKKSQVENVAEQRQHPPIPSGNSLPVRSYIPEAPFAVWVDLPKETGKVVDVVAQIETLDHLSAYWTELKEFRSSLEQNEPGLLAELKAAFAVRDNQMKG